VTNITRNTKQFADAEAIVKDPTVRLQKAEDWRQTVPSGGLSMKFLQKLILILFVLACIDRFGGTLEAASWYVDNAAVGANNGTSWTNAWNSFSKAIWGTGGVKAGDTLYISGGSSSKTYYASSNYLLNVGASGASDTNRITIKVGPDAGHNGTAILDGNGYAGIISCMQDYVTIDGEVNGERHLRVQNNLHDGYGYAVEMSNSSYSNMRYVEIVKADIGIGAVWGYGGRFSNLYLHDIRGDAAIRFNGRNHFNPSYDQTFVESSEIQLNSPLDKSGPGPDGIQGCFGLTVDGNYIHAEVGAQAPNTNHMDFVQMQAYYITIKNNHFRNIVDSALDLDYGDSAPIGHIRIFNNVIDMGYYAGVPSGLRIYSPGGSRPTQWIDIHFNSNTIVDQAHSEVHQYVIRIDDNGSNPSVSNVEIRNNIFFDSGPNIAIIPASSNYTAADWNFDYNLLNAGSEGGVAVSIDGSSYSQAHPRTGVPAFVSYSKLSAANDYNLLGSDTAARDLGASIDSFYASDKNGVARPQNGAWDIGAYEAVAAKAPMNLRITQ
jgi:hypothetical protein